MSSLDNEKTLRLDKLNSMHFLETFPENCKFAFEQTIKILKDRKLKKEYKKFVIFGMGSSGIGASIIQGLFEDMEIIVIKDYDLPKYINEEYFCIAVSYSGNTEEAVSLLKQVKERKLEYMAIASGGKLEETEKKHPFFIGVPKDAVPRFTLSFTFFSLLGFFHAMKIANVEKEANETFSILEDFRKKIEFSNKKNNPAKDIAEDIKGEIPVIYGFGPFKPVAKRAKEQFNENSKVPAFYEVIPQADHNAIMGWVSRKLNKYVAAIVIRDEDAESEEMRKRLDFTVSIMKKTASSIVELRPLGKSILAKVISLIYILDYVSFYLGLLNNIDPSYMDEIEDLKRVLRAKK